MKKILAGVAIAGVALVAALVGAVAMQPDAMHVERSRTIPVKPAMIYPFLSDFQHWNSWDPWSERDPNQKTEMSDPTGGDGAWMTWSGNEEVGSGKMTITKATPHILVEQDLQFITPFESNAKVRFDLEPTAGGTKVTWTMDSKQDFAAKAAGLFMDMDAMIGSDFEQGLEQLEGVARAAQEKAEEEAEKERLAAEKAADEATKALEDAFREALGGEGQALGELDW